MAACEGVAVHEMGLAQAIVDTALPIAGGRPLLRVAVSVGEFQAVSVDSLRFSFELAAAGTDAQAAALDVRIVPGVRLLIDEVEVGGDEPAVISRPGTEVVAEPHEHLDPEQPPAHPAWL